MTDPNCPTCLALQAEVARLQEENAQNLKAYALWQESMRYVTEDRDDKKHALRKMTERAETAVAEVARLTQEQEKRGWQPIATAPKDGRPFLMWAAGSRVTEGFWDDLKLFFRSSYLSPLFAFRPTHWMPLPDPPVTP
jgi:hypothetical protein